MTNKIKRALTIVSVIVLIFFAVYLYLAASKNPASSDSSSNLIQKVDSVMSFRQVRVYSPVPNSAISSPLEIKGEAKGPWFFEASFPVRLLDGNGKQISSAGAEAQGEWMVEGFVPFKVTLVFDKPTTTKGTLVFVKDNPSGLPENADEVEIPVNFK